MLSSVSAQIVKDLGKDNMCAVHGVSESKNVKPFTVIMETTPEYWEIFSSKQYLAFGFQVSFNTLQEYYLLLRLFKKEVVVFVYIAQY